MSGSLSVILDRLTQTLYDLNKRMFINRRIVKVSDEVRERLGDFVVALLQWNSTDREGRNVVESRPLHILTVRNVDGDSFGALFYTFRSVIDRYNDDCRNFVLNISDFNTVEVFGMQRYYVSRNNRLEIIEAKLFELNVEVNRFSIGKNSANLRYNSFPFTRLPPTILSEAYETDAGVCRCDYGCNSNSGCC